MTAASVIYTVETLVDPDDRVEFEAWQIYEHVPALLAMEGYFGVSRFKSASDECRYLNIWRVDRKDRFFSQAHSDAVDTPWKERIAPRRRELKIGFYTADLQHGLALHRDVLVIDAASDTGDMMRLANELRADRRCTVKWLVPDDPDMSQRLLVSLPDGVPVPEPASAMPARRFNPIVAVRQEP